MLQNYIDMLIFEEIAPTLYVMTCDFFVFCFYCSLNFYFFCGFSDFGLILDSVFLFVFWSYWFKLVFIQYDLTSLDLFFHS